MDIFTPITNAECVMPSVSSTNNTIKHNKYTYDSKGGRRKTPRFSSYHSPKPSTRRGRKSRKTSRR